MSVEEDGKQNIFRTEYVFQCAMRKEIPAIKLCVSFFNERKRQKHFIKPIEPPDFGSITSSKDWHRALGLSINEIVSCIVCFSRDICYKASLSYWNYDYIT